MIVRSTGEERRKRNIVEADDKYRSTLLTEKGKN